MRRYPVCGSYGMKDPPPAGASICTRNALLKHPAIASKTVEVHNGVAKIIVYGFKHDFDFKKFSEIGDKIGKGQVDPKEIQVERESG